MTADSSAGKHSADSTRACFALGVDGGGTKTLAWVGRTDSAGEVVVLGKGVAGSSNQVAVGADRALENLQKSVEFACTRAGIALTELGAGVFALAGSANKAARSRILEFVGTRLQISKAQLIHDGQAVLQAGTPDGWGLALVAGTGAVSFGQNSVGETAVVGGWGYWFGDEGSAYWLGQQALRAISQASDGRGPSTCLTERVLNSFGISDPREILSALSRQGDVRSALAGLAPFVCETGASGDKVATAILDEAVRNWTVHLVTLSKKLDLPPSAPIALAGGVVCGCEAARQKLQLEVGKAGLAEASLTYVAEPVEGCLKIACQEIRRNT